MDDINELRWREQRERQASRSVLQPDSISKPAGATSNNFVATIVTIDQSTGKAYVQKAGGGELILVWAGKHSWLRPGQRVLCVASDDSYGYWCFRNPGGFDYDVSSERDPNQTVPNYDNVATNGSIP